MEKSVVVFYGKEMIWEGRVTLFYFEGRKWKGMARKNLNKSMKEKKNRMRKRKRLHIT